MIEKKRMSNLEKNLLICVLCFFIAHELMSSELIE